MSTTGAASSHCFVGAPGTRTGMRCSPAQRTRFWLRGRGSHPRAARGGVALSMHQQVLRLAKGPWCAIYPRPLPCADQELLQHPGNMRNPAATAAVLDDLCGNGDIRRIAGWGSSASLAMPFPSAILTRPPGQFAYYFPKVYRYYSSNLRKLFSHHPDLTHNFDNSLFPAATFNMGPETVSLKHADSGNYPAGGCHIHAGGPFDHKRGGHLILFSLKLVIEFPSGSDVIIPSSTLTHGNTPIQPGEMRVSFTQYCSGGLFRWVQHGFQTLKDCARGNKKLLQKLDDKAGVCWRDALGRFSKVDELHKDRMKVFGKK